MKEANLSPYGNKNLFVENQSNNEFSENFSNDKNNYENASELDLQIGSKQIETTFSKKWTQFLNSLNIKKTLIMNIELDNNTKEVFWEISKLFLELSRPGYSVSFCGNTPKFGGLMLCSLSENNSISELLKISEELIKAFIPHVEGVINGSNESENKIESFIISNIGSKVAIMLIFRYNLNNQNNMEIKKDIFKNIEKQFYEKNLWKESYSCYKNYFSFVNLKNEDNIALNDYISHDSIEIHFVLPDKNKKFIKKRSSNFGILSKRSDSQMLSPDLEKMDLMAPFEESIVELSKSESEISNAPIEFVNHMDWFIRTNRDVLGNL
jgi:hypothetical protein